MTPRAAAPETSNEWLRSTRWKRHLQDVAALEPPPPPAIVRAGLMTGLCAASEASRLLTSKYLQRVGERYVYSG